MKNYIKLLFVLLMFPAISVAQEEEDTAEDSTIVVVKEPLERPAFEGASLIENPTNVLFDKNTLEVQMQHRFGLLNETNTLAGIYGDGANIRIA
ncbi:MAG: DUF5777 family beta-barrel protein, partial [Lutibacter sp.]|nr:DUF5777 family beta-barrel protein [Lutibacter sp.]